MASTAHKTDEEKKEFFDTEEELDRKVELLANMILTAEHFVAFTGAGISTSAGIADFRSGVNTVLPTGPGAWEKAATKTNTKPKYNKPMASAVPTPTHMALVELERRGNLKYLISQNVDGLHRKSGFPSGKLAELHGNTNLEVCKNEKCERQYLRDFRVRTAQQVHDHETGRKCESCGGMLYDSIINFGENLPKYELQEGFKQSKKADLHLVLGSSLRVTPAADMPAETVDNGGQLVIVNLQATPLDDHALRINGMVDDVIRRLMKKLDIAIPKFNLDRYLKVLKSDGKKESTKPYLMVHGIDEVGNTYSYFKTTEIAFAQGKENFAKSKEPVFVNPTKTDMKEGLIKVKIGFQGHYNEPDYTFELEMGCLDFDVPMYFKLTYDPEQQAWSNFEPYNIQ